MNRLAPALIALATFAVFAPALQNGFVNWDDTINFVNNPHYRGLEFEQIRWMLTHFHSAHYMPVSWLTLGADYTVWGMNPFGYHLTNLLIHCANAVLFFYISLRLLGDPAAAAFAALFFSLHPLRVESVAWATERRDVLSGFFFLLTIRLYLRACDESPRRPRLWGALGACVLAVFSKVTSLTLPAVLLVLDFYPLKRRAFLEKIPFAAVALMGGVIGLFAQNDNLRTLVPLEELGPAARLGQAAYGLVFYSTKTIFPYHLSPWYESYHLTPSLAVFCAIIIVAAAAWLWRRGPPWALAAAAFYVAVLFPALGIVKSGRQLVADRYSYLPCLAWTLLAATALKGRKALRIPAAAALCVLGAMTWNMTSVWRDTDTLWNYALSIDPESPFARQNLALGLMEKGETLKAIDELKKAEAAPHTPAATLYLAQTEARARSNLGVDLAAAGRYAEAVEQFQKSLALAPALAETHENLGIALAKQGRLADAAEHLKRALIIEPTQERFRENLKAVRRRLKKDR